MFEPRHAEVPIRSRYVCPAKPKCRRHSFHSGMKGAMSRWCGSAQTTGMKSGTAPGVGVSMAPAPPIRDLVVLQIKADLEGRRPTPRRSLGAGRQSRSTSVEAPEPAPRCIRSSTAPWALDVTRNAGACDAPRRRLLANQPVQNANIRVTSPEATERAENPWNSAIINLARARARGAGLFNPRCRPGRTTSVRVHTR